MLTLEVRVGLDISEEEAVILLPLLDEDSENPNALWKELTRMLKEKVKEDDILDWEIVK